MVGHERTTPNAEGIEPSDGRRPQIEALMIPTVPLSGNVEE
jgi:hypothetical protein